MASFQLSFFGTFANRTSPTTPRSEVLVNHDLLSKIFLHLLPLNREPLSKQENSQGKIQLRNLALTCKAFKDPALDCLWACLDSLLPLIRVLPSLRAVDGAYYPCEVIPEDSQFHRYAQRVRALNLRPAPPNSSSTPSISLHAYIFLASELKGRPLFPTLQKIVINTLSNPTDEFASLPIIFTPSVNEMTFQGEGLANPLFGTYCIPLVRQRLASLKHFALRSDRSDIESSTLDAVLQLTQLESLEIRLPQATKIKPEFLAKAGRMLKKLSSLIIDLHFPSHEVPYGTFPSKGSTSIADTLFPSLVSVHAVTRSGHKLCGCIPPLLQEKMMSVTLILPANSNISSGAYFKEMLDSLEIIQCLEKVEILDQEREKAVLGVDCIKHFLERLNLKSIKIGVHRIKYEGTQEALTPLFMPRVKHITHPLRLRSMFLPDIIEGKDCPTLNCLSYIAQYANGLHELVVGLQAVHTTGRTWNGSLVLGPVGDLLDKWKKRPRSQSTLRFLAIKELKDRLSFTTRDYNDIAQVLDLMFPRLVSIRPYSDADENEPYWKDHWWFIEHLRLMYKELRMYRPVH